MRARLPFLPRLTAGLGVQLALLLTVALLPLGAIAIHTTAETVRDARQSADRALLGMTTEVVAGKRALIESAFSSASALGPVALQRIDTDCRELLEDFVRRSGVFSYAAFLDASGETRCLSDMRYVDGAPDLLGLERILARPRPAVLVDEGLSVGGQPSLVTLQPVFDGGELAGFMAVALAQRSVELMRRLPVEDGPIGTVLFNHDGVLLTSGSGPETLPAGIELSSLTDGSSRLFDARSQSGSSATFAVVELIPRRLFVLGAWPARNVSATGWRAAAMPLLFPALMWLASLGVAFFAVYHLVIRHVRTLNRQMRRFALGHRDTPPAILEDAPAELREVSATFQKLARILARDEAELEASLAEKTVLLKEIHHRVKNNLQLIASILNLQMRQVRDPAARRVLQSVQDRVIGLAAIHRSLYQSERLSTVSADRLVDEISRQLIGIGAAPGSGIEVKTDLKPVMMSPDQLVPLSLLLSEAVTNALKYIGRPVDGTAPWLHLSLDELDGFTRLIIANSLGDTLSDTKDESESTQLGADLIEAFALQLGGTLEQGEIPSDRGRSWQLQVTFETTVEGLSSDPATADAPVAAG